MKVIHKVGKIHDLNQNPETKRLIQTNLTQTQIQTLKLNLNSNLTLTHTLKLKF